jgi:hypothetical protein
VKDGTYGFHTTLEVNPWWQVDLGTRQIIDRILVYNRLDYPPGLHNADHLTLLTSDDGKQWTMRYANEGRHFGGATSGQPLEIRFADETVAARFVRVQLRHAAPLFLHLDEVEIYGPAENTRNLALHRPASQSSLSPWSKGGPHGNHLVTLAGRKITFSSAAAEGILADGKPWRDSTVHASQKEGQTVVEITIPLSTIEDPGCLNLLPRSGEALTLDAQREWDVDWRLEKPPGFGSNPLQLKLTGLEILGEEPIAIQLESIVFTNRGPERRTVFQEELSGQTVWNVEGEIRQEGAAALLITVRHQDSQWQWGRVFFVPPVRETLQRATRLASQLPARLRADMQRQLARLDRQCAQLVQQELAAGPEPALRQQLYHAARWVARRAALAHPDLDFESLLMVKRFTQQTYPDVCLNHMPWCSRPGGDVCRLTPPRPDGSIEPLIEGQLGPGHVHGMDLDYDAGRVVFGYARSESDEPPDAWLNRSASFELRNTVEPTHLFELDLKDRQVRQLTEGEWSDLDPTYLPNGEVAFVSERCGYSLQCNELDKDETSCNLYAVDRNSRRVRRLTVSKDGDYLPHTLDNGLIAYTRWEYQERLWANVQSIWVVRPDGTGADALFKQHFNEPWALEDARSIPGSHKLVAVATGHHTLATGPIVIVDPTVGINNSDGIRIVTPGVLPPEGGMSGLTVAQGGVAGSGGYYQTPWPLSEERFLVSYTYGDSQDETGYAIYLIDVHGTRELLYRDPEISCSHPVPLQPRKRPPVLQGIVRKGEEAATCYVTNIYEGTEGIEPGTIRYLRIAARSPWPYDNRYGGHRFEPDVKGVMINWTPARVLGTVPVEADGSAHFRVPSNLAVYFQALDEDYREVQRMRSFINFQPGETRGCTGCHETRGAAPASPGNATPLAMLREPSHPLPPSWGVREMSFLRDVQPVLDRHCVDCHGGLKPDADIDLSGGLTESHNRAWETINQHQLISRSNIGEDARVTPPYAFGSHHSKLLSALQDATHKEAVRLNRDDWSRLVTWIDLNGPYHANFLNKRPDKPSYNLATDSLLAGTLSATHQKRCAACHVPEEVSRLDWIDIHSPDNSRFLAAPLAKSAGGSELCGEATYRSPADADYQQLRRAVRTAVDRVWRRPRRDVEALLGRSGIDYFTQLSP